MPHSWQRFDDESIFTRTSVNEIYCLLAVGYRAQIWPHLVWLLGYWPKADVPEPCIWLRSALPTFKTTTGIGRRQDSPCHTRTPSPPRAAPLLVGAAHSRASSIEKVGRPQGPIRRFS